MQLFPAIDLMNGQAVRLYKGDFEQQTQYGDPLDVALRYVEAGATHVHLVDLDAAKTGETSSTTAKIVERIVTETQLLVELGGGIRSELAVERWLNSGVWRCVVGTRAAEDLEFTNSLFTLYGDAVIVGIDARDGMVATKGWTENSAWTANEFAKVLFQMGYRECIFTDIERDGTLQGANLDLSVQLATASGLKVVVSGGVSNLQDVLAMKAFENMGISGAIIGKALFSGKIDLRDALEAVRGGDD